MNEEIPNELQTRINEKVLEYLAGKSAHLDVAEAMISALKPLGDVQLFCLNWAQYRYVAASTKGVIFAFAAGMQGVAFRLDDTMRTRALATGGITLSECGEDWVFFELFRSDWPRVDLEFWARKAYVANRIDGTG